MLNIRSILLSLILISFLSINLTAKQSRFLETQNKDYLAFADKMPEPIGGLEAIYKLISYPEIAKKAGVEGKVYVLAFINENGSVDDVKLIKGIGAGCDKVTMDAVKKSKFSPGETAGKGAKVKMSLQIQFKLS